MPNIPLPPGAPIELTWYLAWLGITGLLITLLRLVKGEPELATRAERLTASRLPELNQYLFRFVLDPRPPSPYSPISDLQSLYALAQRVRDTRECQLLSDRLSQETGAGTICAVIHALLAFPLAGAYWVGFPNRDVAILASFSLFSITVCFTLWFLVKGILVRINLNRLLNE